MNKLTLLLLLSIFISSCAQESSINATDTLSINGTIYKKGSSELFSGIVTTHHKNGKIIRQSQYKDGKEHGESMFYKADGSKDFRAYFKHGKEHGKSTFWRKNGNKQFESSYINGTLNGPSTWYFSTGEKLKQYNYTNNKLDGVSTWWDKKGKIVKEQYFKNGALIN